MTNTEFESKITRLIRTEGLRLDSTVAIDAVRRSGADETTAEVVLIDRLHALNSRLNVNVSHDEHLPAALRDTGFRAFLKGLGTVDEWNKLSPLNKRQLRERFDIAAGPSPLARFEQEREAAYGLEWRNRLTATEKAQLAVLQQCAGPTPRETFMGARLRELKSLTEQVHTDPRLESARLRRIEILNRQQVRL